MEFTYPDSYHVDDDWEFGDALGFWEIFINFIRP